MVEAAANTYHRLHQTVRRRSAAESSPRGMTRPGPWSQGTPRAAGSGKQAQAGWADLSIEQLLEELEQIKQFVLLYPSQGEKGPARTAYVLSQQTLAQQALVKTLGLERLHRSTPRG